MSAPAHPPRLRNALEPWCAAGVRGALRVLDQPGGAVYLVDGRIGYAEFPGVSGVDRLLTASGRVAPEAWRAAVTAGRAGNRVGTELVAGGLVTGAELEAAILLALYDAAFFLFDAAPKVRFEPGAVHPLGAGCALELSEVCHEVDRRRRILVDAWPDPAIDTAAVVPVRRLPGQSVGLTALQWEVVANADRRRSPVDLARLLGRDTFTVLLEVRRLARAGLVEPGRPGGSAAAGSVATVLASAAAPLDPPTPEPVDAEPVEVPAPVPPARNGHALPRRQAGPVDEPYPVDRYPNERVDVGCPDETLRRIIAGLAALA